MLSPATLAAYSRDGFIVLPDILEPAQIEALRRGDGSVCRQRALCRRQ
jgi:hypothetical protein